MMAFLRMRRLEFSVGGPPDAQSVSLAQRSATPCMRSDSERYFVGLGSALLPRPAAPADWW